MDYKYASGEVRRKLKEQLEAGADSSQLTQKEWEERLGPINWPPTSRDKRWERVSASIGDYMWPYEDEEVVPHDPVIEFLIEVVYAGTVWYNRILVSVEELKAFPGLYQKTLDKMVEGIDQYLEAADYVKKNGWINA